MRVVPLKQSNKRSCGATCIAMVVRAFGEEISERQIIRELGGLRSYGIDTVRLAAFAQALGLQVRCYSLQKRSKHVRQHTPTLGILRSVNTPGKLLVLTVDPAVLTGKRSVRGFHNILLVKFGPRISHYADPTDATLHRISTKRVVNAWEASAARASAHTVVLAARHRHL